MSDPEQTAIEIMKQAGINFTASLPCDRIKNLYPLVLKEFKGVELTREEDGLGICAGAWLAGAKPMMVIQSTGLGNMINGLTSLNEASGIPIPILASYRGFYKEGIDSQMPLGRHLPAILNGCGVHHTLIDHGDKLACLSDVIQDAYDHCRPHVALVSPKVWEKSSSTAWQDHPPLDIAPGPGRKMGNASWVPKPSMSRYQAISHLIDRLENQAVVCNLGMPAKELFHLKDRALNYYMLGSMGLASSIGLGMSQFSQRKVMVLEGDGSILMNPNGLMAIGRYRPPNLMVLCLDNGVYGSTGSQNTFTQSGMDLEMLARACGIRHTARVSTGEELQTVVREFESLGKTSFIHVVVKPGNQPCDNIFLTPREITKRFRTALGVI